MNIIKSAVALISVYSCVCWFTVSGLNNGRIPTHVPTAHMSSGLPGGGGDNLKYALLVGAASIGGVAYVSKLSLSS